MSQEELRSLKKKKNMFITRSFLSTSCGEDVGRIFAGHRTTPENKIRVMLCLRIEHSEIQDKPIASIAHLSFVNDEYELMLPLGLVFRTELYEEMNEAGEQYAKITMIRGEDERKIEQELLHMSHAMLSGAAGSLFGLHEFLENTDGAKHLENLIASLSRTSNVTNFPAQQQSSIESNINPSPHPKVSYIARILISLLIQTVILRNTQNLLMMATNKPRMVSKVVLTQA